MLDEMENPTVAYKLGMTMKAAVKDPEQVDRLVSECIKRDVLIEDDSMGNGWRVVDDGGMPIIPQGVKHYVWKSRGDCWALWMGLGCP
ncbi:MAG: hypothetical protein JW704_09750, partial [Anaerolineaceae bacterium]|nr:hypothetical protein [Anaerolineaceae bacterium]